MDIYHYLLIVALLIMMTFCYSHVDRDIMIHKFVNLWVNHLLYTRLVMIAFFTDSHELSFLKDRLFKNQKDIGDAIAEKFTKEDGDEITRLLAQHIMTAIDVLSSIKNNNNAETITQVDLFYAGGKTLGQTLDLLYGTDKLFEIHMEHHISTLKNNILAFYQKNYPKDITTLDKYIKAGLDIGRDMA